jgi:hypothetical protein
MQTVSNPALAPFARMDYIVREIAKSMDLDPDKVANSMGQAAVQAEILRKFQEQNPPPPQQAQPKGPGEPPPQQPQAPTGGQVQDTQGSGGATIGTGSVPTPDEPGFSANQGTVQ